MQIVQNDGAVPHLPRDAAALTKGIAATRDVGIENHRHDGRLPAGGTVEGNDAEGVLGEVQDWIHVGARAGGRQNAVPGCPRVGPRLEDGGAHVAHAFHGADFAGHGLIAPAVVLHVEEAAHLADVRLAIGMADGDIRRQHALGLEVRGRADERGDEFTEEEVRLVRIKFISEMAN